MKRFYVKRIRRYRNVKELNKNASRSINNLNSIYGGFIIKQFYTLWIVSILEQKKEDLEYAENLPSQI